MHAHGLLGLAYGIAFGVLVALQDEGGDLLFGCVPGAGDCKEHDQVGVLGDRGAVLAQGLHDQGQLQVGAAGAVVLFRNDHAGQAGIGQALIGLYGVLAMVHKPEDRPGRGIPAMNG